MYPAPPRLPRILLFSLALTTVAPAQPLHPGAMRHVIEDYSADRASLLASYPDTASASDRARLRRFYQTEQATLAALDLTNLPDDDKLDDLLLENQLRTELHKLSIIDRQQEQISALLPFRDPILQLDEQRRHILTPDPEQAAATLTAIVQAIQTAQAAYRPTSPAMPATSLAAHPTPAVANRAAATVDQLQSTLALWFDFYNGYDPTFTWWVDLPYKAAHQALLDYASFLKEKLAGIPAGDTAAIIGDPVGRQALLDQLDDERIPYTPEQLIAIAQTEMDWCRDQMLRASREMGYGEDWHRALEHVKSLHVPPGEQPQLIRKLVQEGIDFAGKHDLVTIPPLAQESWRMEMMTPERQLVNPFFTGGDIISVSYPTNTMTYAQREMSMRGNNIAFARATAFHEMIPGHFLQQYMAARYLPYRSPFATPFWFEGNAFYWEMIFWDKGFTATPEQRVGALFWRMHRSARVIFTMRFHLGEWTPQQCIDFLVEQVGHERDNATAEVRRSFDGSVGPLYQSAYLLGALQFRALHKELVDSGTMTDRAFNDAVLQQNAMPVDLLRDYLEHHPLTRDRKASWKFYGDNPVHP